ncbi:MAG: MAPEG family protein [Pseudomonadales bacterium]
MSVMIISALALVLFQLWLLPASIGYKNADYMISSRDNPPPQTQLQQRTTRAGVNLQESLPAFLALCLLAIILEVDLTQAAFAWLVLRVIYIPCYLFGIIYVRSIVWMGSLTCLIYMGYQLVL